MKKKEKIRIKMAKNYLYFQKILCLAIIYLPELYTNNHENDIFYVFWYAESKSSGHPALSLTVLSEMAKFKMAAAKSLFLIEKLVTIRMSLFLFPIKCFEHQGLQSKHF